MSDNLKLASFLQLEPSVILDAVEALKLRCTGRCLQLNSMENRVYEVELESDIPAASEGGKANFVVVKFYRPGRWTFEQIRAEHQFLAELNSAEIGVVPALEFSKETLFTCPRTDIFFALFPKFSGRNADEFSDSDIQLIARNLARLHQVGASRSAPVRNNLDFNVRLDEYLTYLENEKVIPTNFSARIIDTIEQIRKLTEPFTRDLNFIRIHGDAHKGNLIKRNDSYYWVDFDDFCNGPAVQDLWLLFPGRDSESRKQLQLAVDSYSELRTFDRQSLFLIEPLRTLRVLYFNVWIHKRWADQSFQRTFESFGSDHYWQEQVIFFAEQLSVIQEILASGEPLLTLERQS